jgi:hypothetical protein
MTSEVIDGMSADRHRRAATYSPDKERTMNALDLPRLLRLDGAANVLGGAGVVAAAGWLTGPLGVTSAWPLRILALLLVVYGVENLLVARRPSRLGLVSLITVDLAFAAAVVVVAVADPTSAATWLRWVLVAAAALGAAFGTAKLAAVRQDPGEAEVARHAEHEPTAFFTTDHYRNYPTILIRLAHVKESTLNNVLEDAWRRGAPRRVVREREVTGGSRLRGK